ncbi:MULTISPECIES: hypothetical protein [unclassified Pseudoxanthomonas]|uniref:hypothetical protein n=1 Tax=unclassified Pseudoxanthomonas TaxID=2645906 RepID=UPI0030789853
MKTRYKTRRMSASILLLCGLAAGFPTVAAPTALSPEQVAELYIGMFVNRDMDQAAELVEYLRPDFGGNAAYDLQEYRKEVAALAGQHKERASAMAAELPAEQRAKMEKGFLDYMLTVDYVISQAKCKATDHTIEPNDVTRELGEGNKDDVIATVAYACEIPAVDDAIIAKLQAAQTAEDAAQFERAAADFRKAMQSSSRRTSVTGEASLYRHGLAGVWTNANPSVWLDPIVEGVPSFQPDTGSDW